MENSIEPISKVAFHLGPIAVHWYGIIIGTGLLLGLLIAMRESEKRGLSKDTFLDMILFAVPVAIICARIYYVLFEWGYYSKHPNEIIQVWQGGIAIHGALIGSILTAYIFTKVKGISFWKICDIAAPSLILGQAIGRWGNFINQEAHGREVGRSFLESLHLPDFIVNQMYINGAYYHPTFLYESLWDFVGFIILLSLRRANLRRGELFLTYVIWYSIGRYFIEGMRTDSLMLTHSLRMAQVLSLSLIVIALAIILYRRFTKQSVKRYLDA
ncbi:prolipoprotein diacylglyceryl transferase [Peribacillus kribbensis]|uniref:prolipoprotein diacylglyceryl transferase n=1 Tax=Peribacillus kribbensis TaxID=356658 RepID=UPI0004226C21|nr:prolipoprotein diacylglyceryl transferase [Peribacillus kribbensis]